MNLRKNSAFKVLSIGLSLTLFLSMSGSAWAQNVSSTPSGVQNVQEGFSDISRTHPYYVAITHMHNAGVIGGYDDGTFKAENPIKKAEVTKVIMEAIEAPLDVPFEPLFSDMQAEFWFVPYVMKAHALGIVKGNDDDGTFTGNKQVNLAEFLKMLLSDYNIDVSKLEEGELVGNLPKDIWYTNYISYAVKLGIIQTQADGTVDPAKVLNRGEVIHIMYLLKLILKGDDVQFLLNRAEAEMAQVEVYIAASNVGLAKNASELGVDLTQQALTHLPSDPVVLGAAKTARSYDWLVDAFILGIQGNNEAAAQKANAVIDKATEAWEANPQLQPIAAHLKERAREILTQVGGVEN